MTIDNMGGRSAAIVAAAALGATGTSILFGDVIFGHADFTQKHFQTICIVIATTAAWLAVSIAWSKWHIVAGFGFLVLSLLGTGVIVWYSLGRQTEGQMLSADDHDKAAEERARFKAKLAAEEKLLTVKRNDADTVCKKLGPEHKRCLGARAVESVYVDSLAGIEARLKALQVKPADASAEAFGNLVAALDGNREKAKALALLFMPYLITGLVELGFTWSLHYAFRPSHSPTRAAATPTLRARGPEGPVLALTQLANVTDAELSAIRERFVTADGPTNSTENISSSSDRPRDGGVRTVRHPDSPRPTSGLTKQELLEHVQLELALGRSFPSQQALAGLSGTRKQRVSEWVREWEADGLIPARTQAGRCKSLRSTERLSARASIGSAKKALAAG